MSSFAGMENLDVRYSRIDIDDFVQRFAQEVSAMAHAPVRAQRG